MERKIEEMIALGAAYALNCIPCMEVHKKKAMDTGLTEAEMRAAIGVAEAVKNGAYAKAKQAAGKLFGDIEEEQCCPAGSECCP